MANPGSADLSETLVPESRSERRAHRRAPFDGPVLLETSAKTSTARSVDVSGGGIALRTDVPLRESERVTVYFELPIGYAVEAEAEVLRHEGDLVALRFVEAAHEAIVAVRSFCRMSGSGMTAQRV